MTARTRRRLTPAAMLLTVIGGGVVLGQVALAETPAPSPTPAPTATPSLSADALRGKQLYGSSCASCHGQQGGGTQRGPTLVGVGRASTDFYLSTGRMPLKQEEGQAERGKPAFSRPDIDALVAYVDTFGGGGPGIPSVSGGDLAQGRSLYLQNCAGCHSSGGVGYAQVGGRTAPSILSSTPEQVAEAVRVGPGLMPQFSDRALDQGELDAVTTYVEQLQRPIDRGGWRLGRLGPVAETAVGFVGVALMLLVIRRLGTRAP